MNLQYVLIASDDMDLYAVDGAPFNQRYHLSDLTDEKIVELFGSEFNRILILGQPVFDRVSKLVHFPIRKAKFNALFSIEALTLSSGCKVKCQASWNKLWCQGIFRESWIQAICPDEPVVKKIYKEYIGEAVESLHKLTQEPKGRDFGFDYETSGLPNRSIDALNFRYYQLQGRHTDVNAYSGKTFQITGVSICNQDRESYYYDFQSIMESPQAQEFFDDFKKFNEAHSEDCWVYNAHFETQVSYFLFNKFFIYQDAAAVNYIEGRNMTRLSLKLTTQKLLKIRSWDDAFDDLVDKLNYLLSDAFQIDWNEGTVVQDGVKYVWYESPFFRDAFLPYGEDMPSKAIELAKRSFMNPFLCIPAEILGKYCNVDSYSTLELARYMRSKYSKECIDVFTANLRFHVYLNATGNFIDTDEYKRQKSVANKASNWGMLLLWQFLTKLEIKDCGELPENSDKGNLIMNWCQNNLVYYQENKGAMLRNILVACKNDEYEYQLDVNRLHEALPWDYTYDAIYNAIVGWGGLGAVLSKRNARFWNGNAWIISEYGNPTADEIKALNGEIYLRSVIRRQEWLWYLCNKIPNWDSDVPEYITLDAANSILVSEFVSSDGKPWYGSPEFDDYARQWKLPSTKDDPHYFIAGMLNAGSPSGMGHFKEEFLRKSTGWASILVISWLKYDSYVYGDEFVENFNKLEFKNYDIWGEVKNLKFQPQRLVINPEGLIVTAVPVYDDLVSELPEEFELPRGQKFMKAIDCKSMPEVDRKLSEHPELLGVEMIEVNDPERLGYRYLYVDHFLSEDHLIALFNGFWVRDIRGYKDFMDCVFTGLTDYEGISSHGMSWDWNIFNSTKLDATGTVLDEVRPILGLFTWRKFRKILSTYLKNLLIEGANYTKEEYIKESDGLVISEFSENEWKEGWDVTRGHPNWNCMGVHTKRWSSGFHTLFGQSDTKKIISVPKDKLFFYLDISQAEPRTLAYKSGDPLMKGWYESGRDIYIELAKLFNPDVVNSTTMSDEQKKARLKELRGLYKVLVLAIMYGMGNGALAGMTGKPLNVAKKYKRDFLDAMPNLEKFIDEHMNFPDWDHQYVMTILGDYLALYEWDESRWKRQGINFCIQSFSALALVCGFENMVRTAIHDGLVFSPIGTVHDSSQMIMDARFIYNCQAHFDLNYTEFLYKTHGVKYKGDIKLGVNYYDLAKLHIVNENTIQLEGSADSINKILAHLRNAGVTDIKLDVDESSLIPDYYSSVPKQAARTGGGGAMPDKSSYTVQMTFGDDVIQFHRNLVEGEVTKSEVEVSNDGLTIDSSEFNDNEEKETDE